MDLISEIPKLIGMIQYRLPNAQEEEIHDCIMEAWTQWHEQKNGQECPTKWTYEVGFRIMLKRLKRKKNNLSDIPINKLNCTHYIAYPNYELTREEIKKVIRKLPEKDQKLIYYYYGLGLTLKQTAENMNQSKSAIEKRHQRLLEKCRTQLEQIKTKKM